MTAPIVVEEESARRDRSPLARWTPQARGLRIVPQAHGPRNVPPERKALVSPAIPAAAVPARNAHEPPARPGARDNGIRRSVSAVSGDARLRGDRLPRHDVGDHRRLETEVDDPRPSVVAVRRRRRLGVEDAAHEHQVADHPHPIPMIRVACVACRVFLHLAHPVADRRVSCPGHRSRSRCPVPVIWARCPLPGALLHAAVLVMLSACRCTLMDVHEPVFDTSERLNSILRNV